MVWLVRRVCSAGAVAWLCRATMGGGYGRETGAADGCGSSSAARSARLSSGGLAARSRLRLWRCGAGSCWPRPRAATTKRSPLGWGATRRRSPSGGRGSLCAASTGSRSDDPRPGPPRHHRRRQGPEEVIVRTLESAPRGASTPRSMAAAVGISPCGRCSMAGVRAQAPPRGGVQAVAGPAVHRQGRDVVGLYLNPPEAAVVLCVDEKTGVQAIDRTAPILPLMPGAASGDPRLPPPRHHRPVRGARRRLGQGHRRWRRGTAQRSSAFLNLIDKEVPRAPRRAYRPRQRLAPTRPPPSALARQTPPPSSTSPPPTAPG